MGGGCCRLISEEICRILAPSVCLRAAPMISQGSVFPASSCSSVIQPYNPCLLPSPLTATVTHMQSASRLTNPVFAPPKKSDNPVPAGTTPTQVTQGLGSVLGSLQRSRKWKATIVWV